MPKTFKYLSSDASMWAMARGHWLIHVFEAGYFHLHWETWVRVGILVS